MEQTLLKIDVTFDCDGSNTFTVTDTTDYSFIGSLISLVGILDITAPDNSKLAYKTNYDTPDITLSNRTTSNFNLKTDSRGKVLVGNYTIYYRVLANGVEYYNTVILPYNYNKPTATLEITADGYNSTFTAKDITNISGLNTESFTRILTVTPPPTSPLQIQTTPLDTITYLANVYSGIWDVSLNINYLSLQYTSGNNSRLLVNDTLQEIKSIKYYNINFSILRDSIDNYYQQYVNAINKNTSLASKLINDIVKVDSYYILYSLALKYNDLLDAYTNANKILNIVSPSEALVVSEVQPFDNTEGGGIPVVDDKFNRISGILSPKVLTDKLVIGATTLLGSELLRVAGGINATSYKVGNSIISETPSGLTFTDNILGAVSLSQLAQTGWNPDPLLKTLLEAYTYTNTEIGNAITAIHSPVTISGSILTLTGQQIGINQASDIQSGYLSNTDWQTFNNKQSVSDKLTKLINASFVDYDILSWYNNDFSKIAKGANGTFFKVKDDGTGYEFIDIVYKLSNYQIPFQIPLTNKFSGSNDFTFDSVNRLLYSYNIFTENIRFDSLSNTGLYSNGGDLYIKTQGTSYRFSDIVASATNYWTSTANGIYYNSSIGIGTSTLTEKFNVLGNAKVSGKYIGSEFDSSLFRYKNGALFIGSANFGSLESLTNGFIIGASATNVLLTGDFNNKTLLVNDNLTVNNRLNLFSTDTYIYRKLGDIYFKSSVTSEISLTSLINGSGNAKVADFVDYSAVTSISTSDKNTWNKSSVILNNGAGTKYLRDDGTYETIPFTPFTDDFAKFDVVATNYRFYTTKTEAGGIQSSGKIYLGTDDPNSTLRVNLDAILHATDFYLVGNAISLSSFYSAYTSYVSSNNIAIGNLQSDVIDLEAKLPTPSTNDTYLNYDNGVYSWKTVVGGGGGTITIADQSDVEQATPTENTKATSSLRAWQGFAYWIQNTLFNSLPTTSKTIFGSISELFNKRKIQYAGSVTDVNITDLGSGLINVNSITVNLNTIADYTGQFEQYVITAISNHQLTANINYYLVVEYNSGTPQYAFYTDNNLINHSTIIKVAEIQWINKGDVNQVQWFSTGKYGLGLSNKTSHRQIHETRFFKESGIAVSIIGTRNISMTSGKIWYDGLEVNTLAINSATTGHEMYHFYPVSGVETLVKVAQFPNDVYSNGTDLVSAGNNKNIVIYFWRQFKETGYVSSFIVGNQYNSVSEAVAAALPSSLPSFITNYCVYLGKLVIVNGSNTGTFYAETTKTVGQTPTQNHNELANIQDAPNAVVNEHYHLSNAQATLVDNVRTNNLAEKVTPIDADNIPIWDSVASSLKKISFANLISFFGDNLTVSAGNVTVIPSGGISSTNAQTAFEELDTEKLTKPATAVENNIAIFDSNRQVVDSGINIRTIGL